MEFEWDIFPGFNTLQLSEKSKVYCTDWEKHHKISQVKNHIYLDVQRHFLVDQETLAFDMHSFSISFLYILKKIWERTMVVWQTLDSYLCMQRSLVQDNGHSLVLVLKRSRTLLKVTVHKESVTKKRKRCWWNSPKVESGCPIFPCYDSMVLISTQKRRGHGKLSIHLCKPAQSLRSDRGDM